MNINDYSHIDNACISFFDSKTISQIPTKSGALAKDNEYQVHYWALVLTKTFNDNSNLLLHFPVLFYNYPQEVNGVSIDFELKDVEEIHNKTKEYAKALADKLYAELETKLGETLNEYKASLVGFNTLHRHP